MSRSQKILQILRLEALANRLLEEAQSQRGQLAAEAEETYRAEGIAESLRMPDLGRMSVNISKRAVQVVDEDAFTAWVAQRYPDEIVTERSVRTSWALVFLRSCAGDDRAVDRATGEIVPGLAVRRGGTFKGITITPDNDIKAAMAAIAEAELRDYLNVVDQPAVLAELSDAPA